MIRRIWRSWGQHHQHLSQGSWNTPGSRNLGRAVFAAQGLHQASVSAHQVWSLATFCLIDFDFELIFSKQKKFLALVLQTFDVLFLIWTRSFAVTFFIFLEFLFPRRVSHQASDTSPFPIVLLLNWDQSSCSAAAVVWWWTSWRPWSFKTLASSSYRAKHSISLLRPLWSCEMLQVCLFARHFLCDNHICFRHPDWSGELWHKPPKPCHRGLILSWSETFQFRLHILPPSPCPPQLHSHCQLGALFSPGGLFVPAQTPDVPPEGWTLPNRNKRKDDFCEGECPVGQHLWQCSYTGRSSYFQHWGELGFSKSIHMVDDWEF